MKNLILIAVSLSLAFNALADGSSKDAKKIQGTWLPSEAAVGGKAMGDDFLKSTVLKMTDGKYEVTVAGAPDKGTYTLDASAKPKRIDITGVEGPNAGKTFPSIYELKGDSLRICYALSGTNRPTEFKSPAGTQYFLVVYHRKKS